VKTGRLTTHVLDTARGRPAAGVQYELVRLGDEDRRVPLAAGRTNDNGRTDRPLLEGESFTRGVYELVFSLGEYFGELAGGQPPFLDRVTVRFGVDHPEEHYHVPLLASPYSYTTYRGS
jgi:5-hydroxyisourate hydrolase